MHRGPAVEDMRTERLGRGDARDRRAGVVASLRVVGPGEDDGDGGILTESDRLGSVSRGRSGEGLEQVALDAGDQHLGLGIAEPGVELEHARPALGQHQACEQAADERRAAPGELVDDRLVDALDELGDIHRGDRRVGAHPAGVRPGVAVLGALVVLRGAERERARPVAEGEERDLGPFEQLLDHDLLAEGGRGDHAGVDLVLGVA